MHACLEVNPFEFNGTIHPTPWKECTGLQPVFLNIRVILYGDIMYKGQKVRREKVYF